MKEDRYKITPFFPFMKSLKPGNFKVMLIDLGDFLVMGYWLFLRSWSILFLNIKDSYMGKYILRTFISLCFWFINLCVFFHLSKMIEKKKEQYEFYVVTRLYVWTTEKRHCYNCCKWWLALETGKVFRFNIYSGSNNCITC